LRRYRGLIIYLPLWQLCSSAATLSIAASSRLNFILAREIISCPLCVKSGRAQARAE